MEVDLNEVAVFIKVVELGSFTKAARQLGMPNSTVSSKVSDLEKRLGVVLIRRTTRKLFVTNEGRTFFERCTRSLEEIRAAEEEITVGLREPQGLLRITAPIELGTAILPTVVAKFKKEYPKISFEIYLSDRMVDLIAEGFDIAIRAGDLKDSSLVAKKLGDVYFAPFASPAYLKREGQPTLPKDLKNHTCLQFSPMGTDSWKLLGPKGSAEIPMTKQFVINEANVLKGLTLSGMGISLLPSFMCGVEVRSGKLVRILKDWRTQLRPVHFLYSGHRNSSLKLNAFIEVGGEIIKENLRILEQ